MKHHRYLWGIGLFLVLFFFPSKTFAGTFSDWNIEVQLEKNGDAVIQNTWTTTEDEGTEKYLPITNLENSEIQDFQVWDNGKKLEWEQTWDSNRSREEKLGKYGIVEKSNGLELCFSVGEYGKHTYVFSYRVTNFVKNLKDGQAIYWQFVNNYMNPMPENVYIRINGFEPLTEDLVKMWGFGFEGDVRLKDQAVVARSKKALDSDQRVVLLLTFPSGYFQADANLNQTVEELKDQAFAGSDYTPGSEKSTFLGISKLITVLFPLVMILVGRTAYNNRSTELNSKKRKKELKGKYYREIPYQGAIVTLVEVLESIGDYEDKNLISAYFLKWIKEKAVRPISVEEGFLRKKERQNLELLKQPNFESHSEEALFRIIEQAAGQNKILENKELVQFVKRRTGFFESYLESVSKESRNRLLEEGYVEEVTTGKVFRQKKLEFTRTGRRMRDRNIMFANYLKDYSLLEERGSFDVHIWDEFMIFAALYGITEQVKKQFDKLYPQYETQSDLDLSTILWVDYYTQNMARAYQTTQSSRDIGTGGFTSIGGGGGSFGGGSGGGTR